MTMASGGVAVLAGFGADRDSGYGSEKGFGNPKEYETKPSSPEREELPRAASYTYLPQTKDQAVDALSLKGSFNEDDLMFHDTTEYIDSEQDYSSGGTSPENELDTTIDNRAGRGANSRAGREEKASLSTQTSTSRPHPARGGKETLSRALGPKDAKAPTARRASESSKKLRRRTWLVASRAASPTNGAAEVRQVIDSAPTSPVKSPKPRERRMSLRRRDSSKPIDKEKHSKKDDTLDPDHVQRPGVERNGTLRRASRPLSLLLSGSSDKSESRPPPIPSLPKSYSTDRLPTLKNPSPGTEQVPPMPITISAEKLLRADFGRKKDELWSVFRALDGEFQK